MQKMTGKRNRNKNSGTPKKKRTTRNSPPMAEAAEQKVKTEAVNKNKIGRDQTGSAKESPQHDPGFSPPREVPEDSEKWTPDDLLLDAVKSYFETLSAANSRSLKHKEIQFPDPHPFRNEYRNMFKISKTIMEQNEKWKCRLSAAKRRNKQLKMASDMLNENVEKIQKEAASAFKEADKYSVDDAAQKRALDLLNIRFEELNMDTSLMNEHDDLLGSDDEFDTTSHASSMGVTKYKELAEGSVLANFSLGEIPLLMEEMRKNEKEAKGLQKRIRELDMELAAADRRLQRSREDLGKYAIVVDEVCASDAWKKKNDLI